VEACSVANRSGVGEEAEWRKLHPRIKVTVMTVHSSLPLFMLQLDRFKIELLTWQYFCAHAPTIRTKDFAILWMIFSETGHTLHFSSDYMEVQLCTFGRRPFAEVIPIALNGILIKVSDLANGEVKLCYPRFIVIACFEDCLI
jgi:hypothetical protein